LAFLLFCKGLTIYLVHVGIFRKMNSQKAKKRWALPTLCFLAWRTWEQTKADSLWLYVPAMKYCQIFSRYPALSTSMCISLFNIRMKLQKKQKRN